MTPTDIDNEYREGVKALMSKYGNCALWGDAPRDEVLYVTEKSRARYVLLTNPGDPHALRRNGIPARIIEELGGEAIHTPKQRRSDKYQAIYDWCDENVMVQVTPNQLAEIGDISYPTALKVIEDRPDLFRKVKRGLYEVRDPKAEREADK